MKGKRLWDHMRMMMVLKETSFVLYDLEKEILILKYTDLRSHFSLASLGRWSHVKLSETLFQIDSDTVGYIACLSFCLICRRWWWVSRLLLSKMMMLRWEDVVSSTRLFVSPWTFSRLILDRDVWSLILLLSCSARDSRLIILKIAFWSLDIISH